MLFRSERFRCEVGAASSFGSSSYFSFPTLFSLFFLPFCYSVRPATLVADFRPFSGDGELSSDRRKRRTSLGELFHAIYTLFFDVCASCEGFPIGFCNLGDL